MLQIYGIYGAYSAERAMGCGPTHEINARQISLCAIRCLSKILARWTQFAFMEIGQIQIPVIAEIAQEGWQCIVGTLYHTSQ